MVHARAVIIPSPGGYGQLQLREVPMPHVGAGQVRVRTRAVGVNYADCAVRMGLYESARKCAPYPMTPGFEFSGTVDAVGDGVTSFSVGDAVFGVTRFGGYSTHVVVLASQLWPLPRGFTHARAAGFPVVFLTAHHALHGLANVGTGQHVLVHSAAGGVGGALLQLCRAAGVHAVGVVGSASKVDAARAMGAEHVLVRGEGPWWERARALVPGGFHAVMDASGHTTLRHGFELLRPMGRLVVYGFHAILSTRGGRPNPLQLAWGWLRMPRFNPLDMTGTNRSVMAFNLSYLFDEQEVLGQAMTTLLRLLEDGRIQPAPVTEFDLADVARAHAALEGGSTTGKLVLRTSE